MRAYARAGQQRFDEAIADFEWLRSNNPGIDSLFVPFWMSLAGRTEEALAEYDRMLAERPDSVQLHLDRAKVLVQLGDYDMALADAERAAELDPDNPDAHYHRAIAQPAGEEALAAYDRAIELDPESHLYRGQRAMTHLQLGDYEEAIADARFAVERDPGYANWHWALGAAHLFNSDWADGEEHMNRAIELGHQDGISYFWRGIARLEQDECDAGVADLVQAASLGYAPEPENWDFARETCGAELVAERRGGAPATGR